jgi:hypothetical protein
VKGWIQTAVLDLKAVTRAGADHVTDPVAVLRPPLERPKDQQIQGPL